VESVDSTACYFINVQCFILLDKMHSSAVWLDYWGLRHQNPTDLSCPLPTLPPNSGYATCYSGRTDSRIVMHDVIAALCCRSSCRPRSTYRDLKRRQEKADLARGRTCPSPQRHDRCPINHNVCPAVLRRPVGLLGPPHRIGSIYGHCYFCSSGVRSARNGRSVRRK